MRMRSDRRRGMGRAGKVCGAGGAAEAAAILAAAAAGTGAVEGARVTVGAVARGLPALPLGEQWSVGVHPLLH